MANEVSAPATMSCGSKPWPDAVFLTWERHRRTRGLADRLCLPLREIVWPGPRAQRYLGQIGATLRLLWNERPRIVFVQNPSLLLAGLVLLWRSVFGRPQMVIMDAHNEAVEPYVNRSKVIRAVAHWALRRADFTLVTNRFLAEKVTAVGGRPVVLPDPLPDVAPAAPKTLRDDEAIRVLVVATYAKDEPIGVVLEAARRLIGRVTFQVTGNFRRLDPAQVASVASNVELLGFVPEEEYWERMRAAHVVLDLTLMEDCLVCGAYEAVALGRPLVLSDTRALRDYFRLGALYCQADPGAVASALSLFRREYQRLTREVTSLRSILHAEWSTQQAALKSAIDGTRV
jgi:glycosyltransferase involved in cell wall biosynthesis